MIQTMLIGTDESADAAVALDWASAVAEATGADTTVAEAYRPLQAELTPELAHERRVEVDRRLVTWVASRWPEHLLPPTTVADRGDALSVLSKAAIEVNADVVVIGSKAVEGVTAFGLGSLAHALAHHLDRPMIVVPRTARPPRGGLILADLPGEDPVDDIVRGWCDDFAEVLGAGVCQVQGSRPDPSHADVLHMAAVARGADLIVVAGPDHGRLGRHPLAAVSTRLLHHPTRPIAIVPRPAGRPRRADAVAHERGDVPGPELSPPDYISIDG